MAFVRGKCLLLQRLKEANLSQADLAKRSKRSRQLINDYANDRRQMSPETMYLFSFIIDCSMESLYEWIPAAADQERE